MDELNKEVRVLLSKLINKVLMALKQRNSARLKRLSNYAIQETSVFQDKESLNLRLITYALSKIMERHGVVEYPETWNIKFGRIAGNLQEMKKALDRNDTKRYKSESKKAISLISKIDSKLALYIEEIFETSKVKKGSIIYEHGISAGRVSELLGITKWELVDYIGKTGMHEIHEMEKARRRLLVARQIFNLK